jgi:hypothetical protein
MPHDANSSARRLTKQWSGDRYNLSVVFFSRSNWLFIVLVMEVLAVAAFQSPRVRFDQFAIFDSGGELAIQNLMRRGYRPGIDFGYLYGLLPLLVGRIWYGLAGLTAGSFRAEVMTCAILTTWGLARFAAYRRVGIVGIALIALAIPDLLLVTYIGLVQSLEQALLANALAEHARGRRGIALALLTACCFVKPSLAVLQGLAVVIAIIADLRRANRSAYIHAFAPALLTAGVITSFLALSFGLVPLCRTILPQTGMAVYRLGGFGFFQGIGRDFWVLPHAGLRDYFRYELGFWMLGTAFLIWGGLTGAWRWIRGGSSIDGAINDEICATCAATHIGFIVLIFGHRGTWFYSLPMLVLGVAVLTRRSRWHRICVFVLVALLLISDRSKAIDIIRRWKTEAPSSVTLNLWANPQERAEWAQALRLTEGRKPVLFAMSEGGALLIPAFAPPTLGYLVPGNALPVEVQRKTMQLAAAHMIISAQPPDWPGFVFWPEMKATLDGCELLMKGEYLRVYRRLASTITPLDQSGEMRLP